MINLPEKNDSKKSDVEDLSENENLIPENIIESEEHDLDELVHNTSEEVVSTGEETDLDDAIHKISPAIKAPEDEERDGDDLAHGN